jgi:hypothetical protein
MGYHTIGRFAIGMSAFGLSSGLAVKVGNEDPGPQRMIAWNPGAGIESACGIVRPGGNDVPGS